MTKIRYYYSRISPWLFGFTIFTLGLSFGYPIGHLFVDFDEVKFLILFSIFILTTGFIAVVMFSTRYLISNNKLLIKIGPLMHSEVPVNEIISIERTYDLISSPANSFKRLKINYKKGDVLVSPQKEQQFMQNLKTINPAIIILVKEYLDKVG